MRPAGCPERVDRGHPRMPPVAPQCLSRRARLAPSVHQDVVHHPPARLSVLPDLPGCPHESRADETPSEPAMHLPEPAPIPWRTLLPEPLLTPIAAPQPGHVEFPYSPRTPPIHFKQERLETSHHQKTPAHMRGLAQKSHRWLCLIQPARSWAFLHPWMPD